MRSLPLLRRSGRKEIGMIQLYGVVVAIVYGFTVVLSVCVLENYFKENWDRAQRIAACIVIPTLVWSAILLVGAVAVNEGGKDFVKKDAVRVGVARWSADSEGNATFTWILPAEGK